MATGENKAIPRPPTASEKASKTKRIKNEIKRLTKSYADMPRDTLNVVEGLIYKAAYMRVTLTDWEKKLDHEGWTELFQQSEKVAPYEKKKPTAEMYLSMMSNYQKIMSQLTSYLPKGEYTARDDDDGFEAHLEKR